MRTDAWTEEPPPPSDTGEVRLDFTTDGDTTAMRCDVITSAAPTLTWHTDATHVREYHLMGTALTAEEMDLVFADAATSGVRDGTLWGPSSRTSASAADRATLVARGWRLNF